MTNDTPPDRVFDKQAVKQWRRAIHKELRWTKMASEDPAYRAAMVCATIFGFGTDVIVLAELSGQDASFVRSVLKRLRKMRVLSGQTLRASLGWGGKNGAWGWVLDAMVGAGDLTRPVDKKRSAAQKARKSNGPRKARTVRPKEPLFRPKVTKSNPLYGLPEWELKPPVKPTRAQVGES